MKFLSIGLISAALAASVRASWLDKPSLVTYWGQDSKNGIDTQSPLIDYCDNNSDVIVISFTLGFSGGALPILNLAGTCYEPNFPGTSLLSCPDVGKDIKACQSKGKTILMSLGGAVGNYGFANDAAGEAFADTLWNIYGAGSSTTRPFGDAVLDGFDLDIEGGGPTGYAAMITRLRSHFATDSSKRYYITGAPQCPFPDAMMGKVMDAVSFDAVFVQFYNNYCSTTSNSFNFDTWDKWAKNTSPNKNVKVLLGLPGSKAAAGSGYVPFAQLSPIVKNVHSTYSSFGGIMIWDASEVYANTEVSPNYEAAIAGLVHGLSGGPVVSSTKPVTTTTTTKTSSIPTTTPVTITTSATKTTTTITTVTKTTSSLPTENTGIPCPTNGGLCANNGQYVCAGNSYATCNFNAWNVRGCPSGTTCFSTTDGGSIYCGAGTAGTCPSANNRIISPLVSPHGPIAKAYTSSHVTAQISVSEATASGFAAVINARRLDTTTFGTTVTVQFKVANNVRVTSVDQGTVRQKGNQVKIQVRNEVESKAILIRIEGTISEGIFIAPSVNTMTFS
ncbi:hypothetical protein HPULCUR_004809 [Helicostylum pulchrum]|uniref:chitinase n=1 Tax=Helicostylum pulchrum TaxID=562976 RepID=A0ABP9XX96_9FUNG